MPVEINTQFTLRCENCRSSFLYIAELKSAEPTGDFEDIANRLAQVKNTMAMLRELAAKADWIRRSCGPFVIDLCPSCLDTMKGID